MIFLTTSLVKILSLLFVVTSTHASMEVSKAYVVGNVDSNKTASLMIKAQSVCHDQYNFSDDGKSRSIFQFDIVLSESIQDIKSLPDQCRKKFIENYKNYKGSFAEDRTTCLKNNDCVLFDHMKETYISNLEQLEALGETTEVGLNKIGCTQVELAPASSEFVEIERILIQSAACTPLQENETRVINNNLPGRIPQKYTMTNIGNNTHRIDLNINFVPENGQRLDVANNSLNRMRECMALVNQNANDSKGRKFQFNILSPNEAASLPYTVRPPEITIKVKERAKVRVKVGDKFIYVPEKFRAHSLLYSTDIDCPTTTHEMLHLLGLHDEYHEKDSGYYVHKTNTDEFGNNLKIFPRNPDGSSNQVSFDAAKIDSNYELVPSHQCRSIPKINSIMSNQAAVFKTVIPSSDLCECRKSNTQKQSMACSDLIRSTRAEKIKYTQLNRHIGASFPNYRKFCKASSNVKELSLEKLADIFKHDAYGALEGNKNQFRFLNKMVSVNNNSGKHKISSTTYDCGCGEGDKDCHDIFKRLSYPVGDKLRVSKLYPDSYCPNPLMSLVKKSDNLRDIYISDPSKQTIFTVPKASGPKSSHFLLPAHAEKILFPDCDSRAPKYLRCLEGSYSPAGAICAPKPSYCSDDSWLLDID